MRFLSFWFGLCGAVFLALLTAPFASAQFNRAIQSSAKALEPPRSVQQVIRDAERAIAEARWSEAVVLLGDFLERDPAKAIDDQAMQDYFLDVPSSTNVTIRGSSYARVKELIGTLPAKAMETYRLRYSANAKRLLQEATTSGDQHRLADVRRQYFFTNSGITASIILAQMEWQRGNALACSFLLDDVVPLADSASIVNQQIKVLYATACLAADRSFPKDLTISGPVASVGGHKQLSAGQTLTGEALVDWLADSFQYEDIANSRQLQQYPWLGGLADRNGGVRGQMPLSRPEWIVDTTASPRETEVLERRSKLWQNQGMGAPPTSQPIRVGDQVLIRSTKWLIGVDLETGKKTWTFPWFSQFDDKDDYSLGETQLADSNEENALIERVWNDLPFGQISSDGTKVYFIEGLESQESFLMRGNFRGVRSQQTQANTLVALELQTEGKLSWRVGADEDTASSMSDAFFLGPPISVDDRLYVMAEFSGDIAVLCLDPATGAEIWRQTLGVSEGMPIRFDSARRSAGAMLTYHQGLLICPTGAGLIVAIDLHDRTLRWAKMYATTGTNRTSRIYANNNKNPDDYIKHWSHGAAIASGNRLVFTPLEADRLYALNLSTGDPVMAAQPRSLSLYLAGVRNEQFIVVGPRNVSAFNLSDGKSAWPKLDDWLAPQQRVSGIGVFGPDTYLIPTNTNELIELSLKDGSVVNRKRVSYPLGNLVTANGDLFVQTPTKVTYAAGVQSTQPRVEERLQLDPNDIGALTKKAKIILDRGERLEAISLLRRIETLDAENDEVDQLLIDAMLAELRDGNSVDPELTQALRKRITLRKQRIDFVRLQIDAGFRTSQLQDLPNNLLELSQLLIDEGDAASSNQLYRSEQREVALDDWIGARVNRLLALQDDDEFAEISKQFTAFVQDQLNQPTETLERLLTQFSGDPSAKLLRDTLLKRYSATDDLLRLERIALGATSARDRLSLPNDRLAFLATAYARCGFPEDANQVLLELGKRGALDLINENPSPKGAMTPSRDRWSNRVRVLIEDNVAQPAQILRNRMSRPSRTEPLQKQMEGNLHLQGWDLLIGAGGPIQTRDAMGRRGAPLQLVQSPQSRQMRRMTISGMLAVLEIDRSLIAVDASKIRSGQATDAIWFQEVAASNEKLQALSIKNEFWDSLNRNRMTGQLRNGALPEIDFGPVLGDRLLMLKNGVLTCINTLTGEIRWRNSKSARAGLITVDGDQVCVVSEAKENRTVTTYDLYDGTQLAQTQWEYGSVWGARGRFILATNPVLENQAPRGPENSIASKLYDVRLVLPTTNEIVLEHRTTARNVYENESATIGHLKDSRWLALLSADGNLIVWDIMLGKALVQDNIALLDRPVSLSMIVQDDQLIILPEIRVPRKTNADGTSTLTEASNGQNTVSGAYAYDRESGEKKWAHPLETPWGCTTDQPFTSPLLVLSRLHTLIQANDDGNIKTLDLRAIDTRTGELLAELLGHKVDSGFTFSDAKLVVNAPEQVRVDIAGLIANFEFQYGNEDDDAKGIEPSADPSEDR